MGLFLELFITFFKIGAFTFGGGYAMIPLIQSEIVNKGWLDGASIMDFIAVSESTPGTFAINISTYIGVLTAGLFGAFCAMLGIVLPSFVIILIVHKFYRFYKGNRVVKGVMSGLRPAAIGLIGTAVISAGKSALFTENQGLFVFVASLVILGITLILAFKKVHPILIIALSGVMGNLIFLV